MLAFRLKFHYTTVLTINFIIINLIKNINKMDKVLPELELSTGKPLSHNKAI